ncbi:MAG TPA: amidohydrolase [Blastocatellia bacterium]|nr:amidohydrolase [Blastocatellia bacterium]
MGRREKKEVGSFDPRHHCLQVLRKTVRAVGRMAVVLLLVTTALFGFSRLPEPADLVLINGKVVTVDSSRPQAEAVAILGDKIAAVGTTREIEAYIGPRTRVIDLQGKLVIPGFIEGHGHFTGLGRSQMILDLTRARSWDEIVAMVAEAAKKAKPGAWIFGRGWHQEKWTKVPQPNVEGVPLHHELSRVSPHNPVLLTHASGHAAFVNALALKLAGIDAQTPDPPGGEIVRDRNGEPTGMLRERAQGLVQAAVARAEAERSAEEREAIRREEIRLAAEKALANGVTTFHDAGSSFQTIDLFKKLADEGKLSVRLYVMVRGETLEEMARKLPQYRLIGYGNGFLTVRAIKRQIDGALGPHGAWLLEPYADLPTSRGLALESIEEITRTAELALEHGFQLNTHAIGDRANREVLNIYEAVFRRHPGKKDLRWRIEHAQHLHPDDIPRFARLGVIASMQGIHCTSDGPWVIKRLGEKRAREGAYVWRKLWDAGVVVTNGTDTPVEDINPILSFYATVTRRLADGSSFFPEQRLTREEALKSYTLNNAYAAFEEKIKGSVTPGKLADLVVLSRDIMTIPEDQIPGTEVIYTIVGGKIVYSRQK